MPTVLPKVFNSAPGFNGVGRGSWAECNLPIGEAYTYDKIFFTILKNGVMIPVHDLQNEITQLELVSNLGEVRQYHFNNINPLEAYLLSKGFAKQCYAQLTGSHDIDFSTPLNSGVLTFGDVTRRETPKQEVYQLGTVGISSLKLKILTRDNNPTDNYTISAKLSYYKNAPAVYGFFEKHTMTSIDLSIGKKKINTLPKSDDWNRLILMSKNVTNVDTWVDTVRTHEMSKADSQAMMQAGTRDYLQNDDVFVIPYDASGYPTDALPMVYRNEDGSAVGGVANFEPEFTSTVSETVQVLQCVLARGLARVA